MPTKKDQAETDQDDPSTDAQEATFGSGSTPEVAQAAAEALAEEAEGSAER